MVDLETVSKEMARALRRGRIRFQDEDGYVPLKVLASYIRQPEQKLLLAVAASFRQDHNDPEEGSFRFQRAYRNLQLHIRCIESRRYEDARAYFSNIYAEPDEPEADLPAETAIAHQEDESSDDWGDWPGTAKHEQKDEVKLEQKDEEAGELKQSSPEHEHATSTGDDAAAAAAAPAAAALAPGTPGTKTEPEEPARKTTAAAAAGAAAADAATEADAAAAAAAADLPTHQQLQQQLQQMQQLQRTQVPQDVINALEQCAAAACDAAAANATQQHATQQRLQLMQQRLEQQPTSLADQADRVSGAAQAAQGHADKRRRLDLEAEGAACQQAAQGHTDKRRRLDLEAEGAACQAAVDQRRLEKRRVATAGPPLQPPPPPPLQPPPPRAAVVPPPPKAMPPPEFLMQLGMQAYLGRAGGGRATR